MGAINLKDHFGPGKKEQANRKRAETIVLRLVAFIRQHPGTEATAIPKGYCRLLRLTEHSGLIEYRNGWFVREGVQS